MNKKQRKLKSKLKIEKFKINHPSIFGYDSIPIILKPYAEKDEIYLDKIDISKIFIIDSDLSNVTIIHSNTVSAKFVNTNLNNANLLWNDMRRSDFSNSDLRNAVLFGSDLKYANFKGADLTGADLRNTDLHGANFESSILDNVITNTESFGFHPICPEGRFIAWSRCVNNTPSLFSKFYAKLLIPKDAKRYNGTTSVCRCSKAIILGLYDSNSFESDDDVNLLLTSNLNLPYKNNQILHSKSFDDNRWSSVDDGIHFTISKEESRFLNYNLNCDCIEGRKI